MQKLTFRAMGCEMLAALDADSYEAAEQLTRVPAWFAEWEQGLSRFRPDSELVRLNEHAGQWVPVSATLWDVLQVARWAAQQSGGLVIPTLLAALESAGYDRSFDLMNSQTPQTASARPLMHTDWQTMMVNARDRTVYLPVGMRLDFGGTAKGWAAHQAAQRLQAYGPALLDAGGDIAISGPMMDGSPWPIGVADPFEPEGQVELLMLTGGGVATSGRDYRKWQQDGVWQHHILDPRTQRPATTDVLSATVLAPTSYEAEVGAKVAFILGSQQGIEWLESHPEMAGLLILEDNRKVQSHNFKGHIWG